ncbi:MAG: type II toxin-antitoxin system VapC family toxin [Caulobacteraceae bacterium]
MAGYVVDSSFIVAGLISERHTPFVRALMGEVLAGSAAAPAHLPLEVANALRTKVVRGLIAADLRDASVAAFLDFGIGFDDAPTAAVLARIVRLSDKHGLTVYDAAYLEMAVRLDADLATLDTALVEAARAEGVRVHAP